MRNRVIPLCMALLVLTTACARPAAPARSVVPLVPLDQACVTTPPQNPDLYLTITQQSVHGSGAWRAYPGWTIPVAIDGSFRVVLSTPAKSVKLESTAWRIAPGSAQPDLFIIVPTQSDGPPGAASSTPPSASMIRIVLEGLPPFVIRVVDTNETMPPCPAASAQ